MFGVADWAERENELQSVKPPRILFTQCLLNTLQCLLNTNTIFFLWTSSHHKQTHRVHIALHCLTVSRWDQAQTAGNHQFWEIHFEKYIWTILRNTFENAFWAGGIRLSQPAPTNLVITHFDQIIPACPATPNIFEGGCKFVILYILQLFPEIFYCYSFF